MCKYQKKSKEFKMSITAADIKALRDKTGAGMMDCKKALNEADGDFEKAVDFLRKRGIALAAKRADKTASEGLIGSFVSDNGHHGVLVEVSCETDFVAKNDDFIKFVDDATKTIIEHKPTDVTALLAAPFSSLTMQDSLNEMVAKIGENLGFRRFVDIRVEGPYKLAQYIHPGSKIGVMVQFEDSNEKLDSNLAHDVAMHIAAMNPQFVKREEVPDSVLEKEKEIQRAQLAEQNKPAEIVEKIIIGKMSKYYSEVCVNEQVFVKDPEGKTSVAKALSQVDAGIKIENFWRYQVGESA